MSPAGSDFARRVGEIILTKTWFRAMSGLGVFHYPNGDRLEGQFDKGAASGAGVHFFAAGGRFEGEFTDQGQNARGFMIDPAGQRKPARLENGQFKSSEG